MKANARPKLLTEAEVAEWLQLSIATIRSMRAKRNFQPGRDPIPFVKISNLVRYKEEDVIEWINRHHHQGIG